MRNKKGQVLVETALILPLLLALVFIVVDFGRVMYTINALTNAARAGARVAAVTPSLSQTPPTFLTFSQTSVGLVDAIQKNLLGVTTNSNAITYEVKIPGLTANTGDQVQVILTYSNFPMITPLYAMLAMITGSTQQTPLTLTGQASMRYE